MGGSVETLVFRCDENPETGLGHFARCRDLARLLRRSRPELNIVFAGDLSAYAQDAARQLGFATFAMARDEALLSERLSQAVASGARLLVDSYRLDAAALSALADWPAGWAVFDDFGQFAYAGCQLVINTRVGATAELYQAQQTALGPGYFPATAELTQVRAGRAASSWPSAPAEILVFIGGHDQFGVGPRLARVAAETFADARVVCVQAAALDTPAAGVVWQALGADLAPQLARADLVIAGGGRLKYEALYCLLPCASVSQTAGQAEDTAELARRGLCLDLGLATSFDAARVAAELEALWQGHALAAMRAAQAREFPDDAGQRLARKVSSALALA
jgi:spore coat polysaccharide biosynthesis predicted glycosyltransferase SpsG